MRRAFPQLLLLAAAVLVAVSVYLPWEATSCRAGTLSSLSLFCGLVHTDGWSYIGQVTILAALLLGSLAIAAIVRPGLRDRLPLGQCALATAYFTVALLVQTRASGLNADETGNGHQHVAFGAYVGIAAGILALVAAALLRRDEILFPPARRAWFSLTVAGALLVVLLLPWATYLSYSSTESGNSRPVIHVIHFRPPGVASAGGVIAAVIVLRFLVVRWRDGVEAWVQRLVLAAAALVFASGAFAVDVPAMHASGGWIGIGLAGALVLLSLVDRPLPATVSLPVLRSVGLVGLCALFAASLFLPWERICYPHNQSSAALGIPGRCVSANGWTLETAVAVLAAIGLVAVVLRPLTRVGRAELAAGVILLLTTFGLLVESATQNVRVGASYGLIVGFGSAGLLVALSFTRPQLREVDWRQAATAVPATALAVAYVVAVVLPWSFVLPDGLWSTFDLSLAVISWITLAGAAIGIRLTGQWMRRLDARPTPSNELVLLPLALVVLVLVNHDRFRNALLTWNSAVLGGLAIALTVFGVVERVGGQRRIPIPEILRIDRISLD